jgi:hypothetical protein
MEQSRHAERAHAGLALQSPRGNGTCASLTLRILPVPASRASHSFPAFVAPWRTATKQTRKRKDGQWREGAGNDRQQQATDPVSQPPHQSKHAALIT